MTVRRRSAYGGPSTSCKCEYIWEDRWKRLSSIVTQVSSPLTSAIRPVGGVVAVKSREW